MYISLCTTCHNRTFQLRQVFDGNLQTLLKTQDVEWVILNYNSNDDLHAFMMEQLPRSRGRVIYAHERSGRQWHASIAKNIAHKISNGDVVMNLDADNRISTAVEDIRTHMQPGVGALHLYGGRAHGGTFGRIVVRRELFYQLGGYDESFFPMGFQDSDLLRRIKKISVTCRVPCEADAAITNSKIESIRHCPNGSLTWNHYQRINSYISYQNLTAGQYVANVGRPWGAGKVEFICG